MGQTVESVDRGSAVYECAMCRAPATLTEKSGMGYCETHWRRVHPQRLRRLVGAIRRAATPAKLPARPTRKALS